MSKIARAYASILRAGRMALFTRRTLIEDDITGDVIETVTTQSLATVMLPDSETMSDGVMAGSAIAEKSRKVLASGYAATFAPASGDILTWGAEDWTVLGCSPLDPNGDGDIIYQIGVSR